MPSIRVAAADDAITVSARPLLKGYTVTGQRAPNGVRCEHGRAIR